MASQAAAVEAGKALPAASVGASSSLRLGRIDCPGQFARRGIVLWFLIPVFAKVSLEERSR